MLISHNLVKLRSAVRINNKPSSAVRLVLFFKEYKLVFLLLFQGFFIFILHVLRNGDVRAAYSRKMQKWKQSNSIGTSHAANHNSIDMSLQVIKETEDSKNKPSNASLRLSVGHGSTVAMQQETYMTPVDT